MSDTTMVFAITQSGETADTLAAMRECKRKGHPTLAICNVVGSSIAREADGGIYLHAGPEIGVASTKAFTSQVTVLMLLALYLGRHAAPVVPAGNADDRPAAEHARNHRARRSPATTPSREVAEKYHTGQQLSCTWGGCTTSPWPWKGR